MIRLLAAHARRLLSSLLAPLLPPLDCEPWIKPGAIVDTFPPATAPMVPSEHPAAKPPTVFNAPCDWCGDVWLTDGPSEVTLLLCRDTCEWSYRFRCPECERIVLRSARHSVASAIALAGVPVTTWTLPDPEAPTGPPFTVADIAEFLGELQLWPEVER